MNRGRSGEENRHQDEQRGERNDVPFHQRHEEPVRALMLGVIVAVSGRVVDLMLRQGALHVAECRRLRITQLPRQGNGLSRAATRYPARLVYDESR